MENSNDLKIELKAISVHRYVVVYILCKWQLSINKQAPHSVERSAGCLSNPLIKKIHKTLHRCNFAEFSCGYLSTCRDLKIPKENTEDSFLEKKERTKELIKITFQSRLSQKDMY